jgi:hypothetical protein
MIGLGVLPSFSADMAPPAPVAEYDEPEPIEPVAEAPPVVVAPIPPAPVVGPPAYVYEGYNYCWFSGGWHGPGWYVCDYGPWIRGSWWGGPAGWNGWAWRGGPRLYDRPYGYPRAGFGRPYAPPPRAAFDRPYEPRRAGFGPRSSYARGGYGGGHYRERGHWRGDYR